MAWPLDRYADLVVQVGVNVQPKQHVFINALVEHRPLVRELVRSAYEAGAAYVDVRYQDPHVRRAFIQLAPEETLTDTPGWILERSEAIADGGAVISLTGDDEPELLADLDLLRVGKARPIAADQVRQRGQMERTLSWTIVGCATPGWAEQIFGEPDLERLWEAIGQTVRLDEPDPAAAWQEHVASLRARCDVLNGLDLDSIRFSGPGTDLEIGLLPTSSWSGGGIETKTGVFHVPNMPTEEVFTCPDRRRTRGHVRSTRPLSLGGTIVWDLEVAFEDGAIVDVNASAGADAVRGQLQVDEWAPYLGEVALVDGSSRVGRTGMVFSNTLFDENATCHIAYGNAVQFALEDGGDPNDADAARAQGVNVSVAHTDFMIGGPEVTVDGITRNGRTVRLIEGDRWQI